MKKCYRFEVDLWAIALIAVILLPNILWALFPPADDVLKAFSGAGKFDIIGSTARILMLASIVLLKSEKSPDKMHPVWKWHLFQLEERTGQLFYSAPYSLSATSFPL